MYLGSVLTGRIVLGRAFAVFKLHTLFALTITLIVVPFVVLAITGYGLYSSNKMYYFSNTPLVPAPPSHSDLPTTTRGWRGFFRFPVAFVVGSAATIGLAYLVQKVNPMIAYSSQYSVWAMFLSAWWCLVWFIMRGADAIRPSALGRGYAFLELWLLWFAVMIGVAVSANVHKLASGYFVLIIYSGITLSAWISLLELSALPKKRYSAPHRRHERVRSDGHSIIAPSETHDDEHSDDDHEDTPADESTPLFRGRDRPNTFHGYARTNIGTIPSSRTPSPPSETDDESDEGNSRVYPGEQSWASHLPAGTWIIQHLLSIPVPIMFVGNIMLLLSGALSQTGADGSDTLTVYLAMAVFSIIFLLPAAPFFHRISYHLTTVVFFVFVATLLTNLLSFPFDNDSRLKVYFQQTWDLTPGAPVAENKVHLIGHADFVKDIAEKYIPSARHTELSARPSLQRVGLAEVTWPGPAPNPVPKKSGRLPKMIVNATSPDPADPGMIRLVVSAEETRACRIDILNGRKVKDVSVYRRDHGDSDANKEVKKLGRVGRSGQIRLWRRSWDVEDAWEVTMRVVTADEMADGKTNDDDEGKDGVLELKVSCLWSDANSAEVNVPALWELWRFLPTWAAVSKLADGLVEGWIKTEVEVGR